MDFGFSEEQNLLREQVARFMTEACPLSVVRAQNSGFPHELWQQVADLGWLALIVPETHGGLGLKWIDLAVVLEESGRGLSPLPILSQALAATAIGRSAGDDVKSEWLPKIATGDAVFGVGLYDDPTWIDPKGVGLEGGKTLTGTKPFVSDATGATHLLLATRNGEQQLGLAIVDAGDATLKAQPGIDRTKPFATVSPRPRRNPLRRSPYRPTTSPTSPIAAQSP